jgi:hypothetical protein
MTYVLAKPVKIADDYEAPTMSADREKEIADDRERTMMILKRKRDGSRPKYTRVPENGSEPIFKEAYWCWTTEVDGKVLCWDETTQQWMDRDLFAQSQLCSFLFISCYILIYSKNARRTPRILRHLRDEGQQICNE